MVKNTMKNFCFSLLFLFVIQKTKSQSWVPLGTNEQTSTSIAATGANTFFTAVSNGGVPYVSYIDDAGGPNNLGDFKGHARRFINGSWQAVSDGFSAALPGSDFFPIALDADTLYAAYAEGLNPVDIQLRLTVKRLNNSNNQWETVGQRAFSAGGADGMAMAVANRKVYIAYLDGSVNGRVTVKYFDNANPANGWQTLGTEGISDGYSSNINLVIDNGIPYVAYIELSNHRLSVKKFNGAAWGNVGTNDPTGPGLIISCSLQFNSQHIPYVAYGNSTGSAFVHKLNNLNTWVPVGEAVTSSLPIPLVSLVILGDIPFIAFGVTDIAASTQVTVKKYTNNTWADAGYQPVTQSIGSNNNFALTTDGINKLFVVYRNLNTGAIYAKSFDASGILPVTLTDFSATKVKDATFLQWVTASEQNNKVFDVEYSTNAVTFNKIGEVAAKGNSNVQQQYSFIHSSPVAGINYYRLKQIDGNGNYSYSKIISVAFGQQQPALAMYPNPVQNVLHITGLDAGAKDIVIYSADGKVVKRVQSNASSVDINASALAAGTYFISVYGNGKNETQRFIK